MSAILKIIKSPILYASELARHQNRVILFRYNPDLSRVFGVVNTSVYDHAKPATSRHGVKVAEPTSTTAKCFAAIATDAKANNDILTRSRL